METSRSTRGFASMHPDKQREIARKGGRSAHQHKTAHEFTTEEARAAGRKGGERVSLNREHMARIGRLGGRSSADRRRSHLVATSNDGPQQREHKPIEDQMVAREHPGEIHGMADDVGSAPESGEPMERMAGKSHR